MQASKPNIRRILKARTRPWMTARHRLRSPRVGTRTLQIRYPRERNMSVENKETRCLTNEDFWRLRTISEFRLSPDGERVAYTVNWLDEDTDSVRSAIW